MNFDELSELYASTMLRSTGLSLVGIFVPIYLYKLGYELPVVFLFMASVYAARIIGDFVAGYLVAWRGPKHSILISYVLQVLVLVVLLTLPMHQWPLWPIAVVWGISISTFFVAYHVDFSKIMHMAHGGKELGFMTIMERLGAALGPVVGGVVATFFGPEYTIMAAIGLFVLAVIPLFLTAEPVRTNQKLSLRSLPFGRLKRDFVSFWAMGFDNNISVGVWPLYIAVAVFTVNTYASVGLVTTLGILAAILAARFIGQVVDHNQGVSLLRWSVAANSLVHAVRPMITSFGGALMVNMANETVSTGYKLPYSKGMYARADELPGLRIVYIIWMEAIGDAGKSLAWLAVWGLSLFVAPVDAMWWSFILVAPIALWMAYQNFPGLKPRLF